jgi:hypothetical protein
LVDLPVAHSSEIGADISIPKAIVDLVPSLVYCKDRIVLGAASKREGARLLLHNSADILGEQQDGTAREAESPERTEEITLNVLVHCDVPRWKYLAVCCDCASVCLVLEICVEDKGERAKLEGQLEYKETA